MVPLSLLRSRIHSVTTVRGLFFGAPASVGCGAFWVGCWFVRPAATGREIDYGNIAAARENNFEEAPWKGKINDDQLNSLRFLDLIYCAIANNCKSF